MTNVTDGVRRWSGSVVEHLRAVHLLLVITSVGLILVAVSAKPYTPAAALTQLEEIQRLQKDWSAEFLHSQVEADHLKATSVGSPKGNWAPFPQKAPYDFPCWVKGQEYNCKPEQNWWVPAHDRWSLTSFPKTIADFKEFWDSLATEQSVDFVSNIGEGITRDVPPMTITVLRLGSPQGTASSLVQQAHGTILNKPLWLVKDGNGLQFWDAPDGASRSRNWEIPVQTVWRIQIDQKALAGIIRDWKPGDFDSAFRDLAQASRGMEELDYDDVRRQFETESAGGSEVLEVAGLKIPTEQMTTVGILSVLCIQLYLLALLRELWHKLHFDDSGWEVPWIGMFASQLAQFATWFGVIVCPIVAVVLLVWPGFRHAEFGGQKTFSFLYALPAVLSCVLAGFSWIYRPKLEPGEGHS